MLGHYLMFNGNCVEALELYKAAFGAEIIEMQKYEDMPPNPNFPIADDMKNLVLHSRLNIDGAEIMCSDAHERSAAGSNMYVSITSKNETNIQKAWNALKKDGEIYMELSPSFFATLHGSLRDKFGINWMFTAMK